MLSERVVERPEMREVRRGGGGLSVGSGEGGVWGLVAWSGTFVEGRGVDEEATLMS